MLLKEIKNIFHKELEEVYPKEEVDSFFYMLIEHYLGLERFVLALQPNLAITKQEEQPIFEALSQLGWQRPIQYIIGTAHFMEMDFKVDENVLIPRPETEELVQWILADIHNTSDGALLPNAALTSSSGRGAELKGKFAILDIGTGSGCIAVSLAKKHPEIEVHALDVSVDALSVARKNARKQHLDVRFFELDILTIPRTAVTYDIIVSNPPYVREQEKKVMNKNVTDHEPGLALFVADENPLKFYDAIARFAQKNLKKEGRLYLEINQYLGKETEQLFRSYNFSEIELRKDMFGNPRMMKCVY